MGCPGRQKGLAAGIVIVGAVASSCWLPGPVDGNAEQARDDDVADPQP